MPFFVPVYLWQKGLDLTGLCLLLGVSGLAFSLALGPWQLQARDSTLRRVIYTSFVLELALVLAVIVAGRLLQTSHDIPSTLPATPGQNDIAAAMLVGVLNGAYNAYFWTTQRTLFAALGDERDSGRRYGNLQIVVAIFLKGGILMGGVLLEANYIGWALAGSTVIAVAAMTWLARDADNAPLHSEATMSWRESIAFRDGSRSAGIFTVDGPFLYLESHFWTLTLFLLVREDSARLGVMVVVLAAAFSLLFMLVKNRIDRTAVDIVYRFGVGLYALSWLMRTQVSDDVAPVLTLTLLIAITFCSSLFRLTFNKRFFDVAGASELGPVRYLVAKSHVSQLCIACVFLPLAAVLFFMPTMPTEALFDGVYSVAAVAALLYWRYRR